MIIGSHVSMSGKEMLLGSVKEAVSYGANTFMFYTGAPQNTARRDISELRIEEAYACMEENGIELKNLLVHAPYIINLANTTKPETFELAVSFLKQEIERCKAIGVSTMVLHPGSHVNAGVDIGLKRIVEGLDLALGNCGNLKIALETMAGKGSELGTNLEELKYIIDHCKYGDNLGVCLDTCHLHDSGVDISKFDEYLDEFDQVIGIDRIYAVHVNDSKNVLGASKDRHENIGYGEIGFDALCSVVHNERLIHIPKFLETPYVDKVPPYKMEIEMLKNKCFEEGLK